MTTKIIVPILGESITQATLLAWLKQEGEMVKRGDEIAELETSKATMTLESPANGQLLSILIPAGTEVVPGQLLAVVGRPGEEVNLADNQAVEQTKMEAPPLESPEEKPQSKQRRRVSPAARRFARELGVDISQVDGLHPEKRITTADVRRLQDKLAKTESLIDPVSSRRVLLNQVQKTIAERMMISAQQIPQFSVSMDIDVSSLLAVKEEFNRQAAGKGEKISLTAMLIHLLGRVLPQYERLNASYDRDAFIVYDTVNIAVAVAAPRGLVAPIIHGVEVLKPQDISNRLAALALKARAGKLDSREVAGGTFTISNLGMLGVSEFIPLVNPPQTGILGVGTVRPVVLPLPTGGTRHTSVMKLTLSADHRVVDGAGAAEFLNALREAIENYSI